MTHDFLIPLIPLVIAWYFVPTLFQKYVDFMFNLILTAFVPIFSYIFADAFNKGGVSIFRFRFNVARFSWDSKIGNYGFRIIGLFLVGVAGWNYLVQSLPFTLSI